MGLGLSDHRRYSGGLRERVAAATSGQRGSDSGGHRGTTLLQAIRDRSPGGEYTPALAKGAAPGGREQSNGASPGSAEGRHGAGDVRFPARPEEFPPSLPKRGRNASRPSTEDRHVPEHLRVVPAAVWEVSARAEDGVSEPYATLLDWIGVCGSWDCPMSAGSRQRQDRGRL